MKVSRGEFSFSIFPLDFVSIYLHVPWSRIHVTRRVFVSRISTTYNGLHGKCDVFGAPSVHSFRRQVSCALSQSSLQFNS